MISRPNSCAIAMIACRRSRVWVTPVGFWKFGIVYRNFTRLPAAFSVTSALRSASGSMPCSSIATWTISHW